ncbi:MAG TPA: hypothetical protein VI934_03050 [Candidatus Nanoarchaeia archaeon]|nr:hypothetical protein [Candidatus Nanoarchaeia archaeon]
MAETVEAAGAARKIEAFKAELAQIRETLSAYRRQGRDVFIAQLKATALPAKIKMAEATKAQKDLAIASDLIISVKNELGMPANQPITENATETFKRASASFHQERKEGIRETPLQQVNNCIAQAEEAIASGEKEQAIKLYNSVREKFTLLGPAEKKEVTAACQKLLAKLR